LIIGKHGIRLSSTMLLSAVEKGQLNKQSLKYRKTSTSKTQKELSNLLYANFLEEMTE